MWDTMCYNMAKYGQHLLSVKNFCKSCSEFCCLQVCRLSWMFMHGNIPPFLLAIVTQFIENCLHADNL
jgi:hypothetical protein